MSSNEKTDEETIDQKVTDEEQSPDHTEDSEATDAEELESDDDVEEDVDGEMMDMEDLGLDDDAEESMFDTFDSTLNEVVGNTTQFIKRIKDKITK